MSRDPEHEEKHRFPLLNSIAVMKILSPHRHALMKGLSLAGCMIMLGAGGSHRATAGEEADAPLARKGATRDIITEDALRRQVESTVKFDKQMGSKAKPLDKSAPSMENILWMHSLLLFDGEKYTIIPEGSILHLPVALQSKLISKAQGDFMFWPNFLKRNASWLGAKEVPLAMAKGDPKLSEKVLAETASDPRALVAVYKGGPIMILEPAPPAEETTKPDRDLQAAGGQPAERR